MHTLTKAEFFNPSFDESFTIFALRQTYSVCKILLYYRIKDLDDLNQRDIANYLSWQNNLSIARKEDENATVNLLRFWTELCNSRPVWIFIFDNNTSGLD